MFDAPLISVFITSIPTKMNANLFKNYLSRNSSIVSIFFWLQEAPNDGRYPQFVKTIETVSTSIVSPSDTIVLNFYIYQTNNDCWLFSNTIHYIFSRRNKSNKFDVDKLLEIFKSLKCFLVFWITPSLKMYLCDNFHHYHVQWVTIYKVSYTIHRWFSSKNNKVTLIGTKIASKHIANT
jgi:hypothetical protein